MPLQLIPHPTNPRITLVIKADIRVALITPIYTGGRAQYLIYGADGKQWGVLPSLTLAPVYITEHILSMESMERYLASRRNGV